MPVSKTFVQMHNENLCRHVNILPSILYALLDEYCLLIFRGKTIPWYLSMAMHVMVRMPVTMAVVCTKGTVLHTKTPAANTSKTLGSIRNPKITSYKYM